jgi:hypothetical protein
MPTRHASCCCGQLVVDCTGAPSRISICHCLDCQRRTGSVFGVQARYPQDQVRIQGRASAFTRGADSGQPVTFRFCPDCGSTVYYTLASLPGVVGVAVGAFADPGFPAPRVSVYEARRHPWTVLPALAQIEHCD